MKFAMRETKAVFAVTPTTATDLNALSISVLALALAQTQSLWSREPLWYLLFLARGSTSASAPTSTSAPATATATGWAHRSRWCTSSHAGLVNASENASNDRRQPMNDADNQWMTPTTNEWRQYTQWYYDMTRKEGGCKATKGKQYNNSILICYEMLSRSPSS